MTVDAIGPTLAEGGPPGAAAPAGQTLGKYRLDRVIGAGGMGVVWQGYDPDLERAVAIKVLRDAGDTALRTRLLREARAMARLKHPNVLVVYEVGTDANRDYIAMELVDGGDLTAWLPRKPAPAAVMTALLDAGRGLAAAHDAGLVHRDFKPHNILRGTDGRVYVTDFGLARGQLEPAGEVELVAARRPGEIGDEIGSEIGSGGPARSRPLDSVLDSELTQTGVLIGTPAYMAPEQFAGLAPDPRTDQFAFCVTAWEAIAGVRPFRGDTLDALRDAVGRGVAKTPGELPPRVRAILARGLAPEPAARWPDMRALLGALEAAGAPRRRWTGTAVAIAIGALASAALLVTRHDHAPDPPAPASAPLHGTCAPAGETFARVWSPTRRAKLATRLHGGKSLGAIALIDEVHRAWTTAYDRACDAPSTAASHAQIACLLAVLDELRRETTELDDDDDEPDIDLGDLALLTGGVKQCASAEP